MDDEERIERDRISCEALLANFTVPEGPHCEGTFDSWVCWPPTAAGHTARQFCPDFVPGFSADLLAHKECSENATWFRHPLNNKIWSNYTLCVKPENDVSSIIIVYEAGYSVSLIALLLSLATLLYFKSLRCPRITVHMNLFVSFALNNALWLSWYALVVNAPDTARANPAWCRALAAALQYALLGTYLWMLCEGLYLHTVLVYAFVAERRLVRWLAALGWAGPLPFAALHAWRRANARDGFCWADEGAPRLELAVPAVGAVLLNALFLVNIVRVLCTKLRAPGRAAAPPRTALHAVRATCLLAPLLGLQFLLTPSRPSRQASWWRGYEVAAALVASLQGLAVALLFCFCNAEVLAQIRRRWRVLTFRARANSTTNTTVSFVRSGACGPCEEKV